MNIIVVGDSWGVGEWNNTCTEILHLGLEQYLINDSHNVINISKGGISNLDIIFRLQTYLNRLKLEKIDKIIVFQTEFSRDYKFEVVQKDYGSDDWLDVVLPQDYSNKLIERFYIRLSEISQKFNIPIQIIGGCGDALWIDNMQKEHIGCEIVCQSLTNLIIQNNSRIENPIFSWYTNATLSLVEKFKTKLSHEGLNQLIVDMNLGFERELLLRENPYFFYPDGVHPNRRGHKILFEYLKDNNKI